MSICKRESPNDGINPWSSLSRKGSRNTLRDTRLSPICYPEHVQVRSKCDSWSRMLLSIRSYISRASLSIPSSTWKRNTRSECGRSFHFMGHIKIWIQKRRALFPTVHNSRSIAAAWSFLQKKKRRIAVRLKRGVQPGELRPLYEDREKVTVTEVILHPAEQHARVSPLSDIQGGTYSSEHMARRASGAPVVAARSWHVRARGRTDEWIVHSDVSRVRRCTRIAFPLGLLPIFVGRPLIGNNRLDGFAADFTVCPNEGPSLGGEGRGKDSLIKNVWFESLFQRYVRCPFNFNFQT